MSMRSDLSSFRFESLDGIPRLYVATGTDHNELTVGRNQPVDGD